MLDGVSRTGADGSFLQGAMWVGLLAFAVLSVAFLCLGLPAGILIGSVFGRMSWSAVLQALVVVLGFGVVCFQLARLLAHEDSLRIIVSSQGIACGPRQGGLHASKSLPWDGQHSVRLKRVSDSKQRLRIGRSINGSMDMDYFEAVIYCAESQAPKVEGAIRRFIERGAPPSPLRPR